MSAAVVLVATTALVAGGVVQAGSGPRVIVANGVRVSAPAGWHRVPATPRGPVADPTTVLVVGTGGVHPNLRSQCQVAAYRLPPRSAVVVIVRWRTTTSGGGRIRPGRAPLEKLVAVARPSFECFGGRGAAAQVSLGGHAYQVNVMVGAQASARLVADALAVARSFELRR
jgi:hypothetical protein